MVTLILLLGVLATYSLLFLSTKAYPESFMGINRTMPQASVIGEVESREMTDLELADEALFGASCVNCKPRDSKGSTDKSIEGPNPTDVSKGMKYQMTGEPPC
jgi:hypothetical protein